MVAFVLFVGLDNKDIHNTSSLILYVAPVYNLTMLSGFLFTTQAAFQMLRDYLLTLWVLLSHY